MRDPWGLADFITVKRIRALSVTYEPRLCGNMGGIPSRAYASRAQVLETGRKTLDPGWRLGQRWVTVTLFPSHG